MQLKLGVVMDPIATIKPYKDSTLAMLLAAQARGWPLWYMTSADLQQRDASVSATMRPLQVFDDNHHWYELGAAITEPLAQLDVILMRKDPPFDIDYIYATYLLQQAEQQGVWVVNRPQSLRDANEKLFALQFPQCTPPTLVSADSAAIRQFLAEQGSIVVKPLGGMGGASIFRIDAGDSNTGVIIETLTEQGKRYLMAQRYLPEIVEGDRRILLIDGEPVPYALARIPAAGELRGNLAAGGRGVGVPLSERDRWICDQIAPQLRAMGLLFVGIDVIGDYLTEINVTSPTCIRELDAQYGLNIADDLMAAIARQHAAITTAAVG